MTPEVSIIVPVYRVEPYLRRCVDSILAQTFTDYELILVDDGSPDNCGAICDEYAEKDKRIRVIHKQNGGIASARNAGMDLAVGEFILFCDSDDYVLPAWCERLHHCALEHPDLCVFGNMQIETTGSEGAIRESERRWEGEKSFSDFFNEDLPGFAWNKLFRAEIIRTAGLRFPEDVIIEDLPFVLSYFCYCKGLFACADPFYIYYRDDRETLSKQYYTDGYKKWREKYAASQRAITALLPERERLLAKRNVAGRYLYYFLHALDNTFDERNRASLRSKLRFNQKVIQTPEFRDCLRYADTSGEDGRYIALLRHRSYGLAYLLKEAAKLKRMAGKTK